VICLSLGTVVIVGGSPYWSNWFGLDDNSKAMLFRTLPLAFTWIFFISLGCGSLRNNLTGMGLVRWAYCII
jgi:hypothetical protein